MSTEVPRGVLWRLELAQKLADRAAVRVDEGHTDVALRLLAYARSLLSEIDDDYQAAVGDGRVVTARARLGGP